MGALYEDVEKFFGDIFASYGRFLARYPIIFIAFSMLGSILLGLGLLNIQYETRVEKLYTPEGSLAYDDQAILAKLFPEKTDGDFYFHQLYTFGTYGEIIMVAKNIDENVLTEEILQEVRDLFHFVFYNVNITHSGQMYRYLDLCANREHRCIVDGEAILTQTFTNSCFSAARSTLPLQDDSQYVTDLHNVLSGLRVVNGCVSAKAFKLRFNLAHDTPEQRTLSLKWEKQLIDSLNTYKVMSVKMVYSVSESLDIELNDHMGEDTKFFALTIIIMIVYATIVSSGGNWVSTRGALTGAGVVAALMAILASFGLLSLCGLKFVDTCGVMPFLVLGVGVDDMFILMSGWRQSAVYDDIEDRVAETLRTSAISVTITSLTDLLAFCIGATSPFLGVKNFCVYAGVAIFLCYVNQLTFFSGCLVLHARRVKASRHCVTCMPAKTRAEMEDERKSHVQIILCSGHPPRKPGEADSPCEKGPGSFLPRLLLHIPTKFVVVIAFFVYLGVSIWGASRLQTGLKLEKVVPANSYLSNYLAMEDKYFSTRGPVISFILDKTVQYNIPEKRELVHNLLATAQNTGYVDEKFHICWLDHYVQYRKNHSYRDIDDNFVLVLKTKFLKEYPRYKHDILFNPGATAITASRFYLSSYRFKSSTKEGNMMLKMRELAKNSSLPVFAFSPEFIYYEHYVSILKNTLLAVGVAVIGMLFVAIMFIPHPISVSCVTVTMVTIVLGMFGFMHFWGLALSAITNVQVIISVGFCVDFTVHISHAFMTATGKNRNERVAAAIEKVGVPILNGAITSILGILMLAFARSYIYISFFKTMMLVIALGAAHSLLLLPVLLSFIGPRRTSKPRMYLSLGKPILPANLRGESPKQRRGQRHSSTDSKEGKSEGHHSSYSSAHPHRHDSGVQAILKRLSVNPAPPIICTEPKDTETIPMDTLSSIEPKPQQSSLEVPSITSFNVPQVPVTSDAAQPNVPARLLVPGNRNPTIRQNSDPLKYAKPKWGDEALNVPSRAAPLRRQNAIAIGATPEKLGMNVPHVPPDDEKSGRVVSPDTSDTSAPDDLSPTLTLSPPSPTASEEPIPDSSPSPANSPTSASPSSPDIETTDTTSDGKPAKRPSLIIPAPQPWEPKSIPESRYKPIQPLKAETKPAALARATGTSEPSIEISSEPSQRTLQTDKDSTISSTEIKQPSDGSAQ